MSEVTNYKNQRKLLEKFAKDLNTKDITKRFGYAEAESRSNGKVFTSN